MPRLIFNAKTSKLCSKIKVATQAQQTAGEPDRAAFETASKPAAANSAEFAQIAKMAASVDTLDGFLRDMKARGTTLATYFESTRTSALLPDRSANL